MYIFTSAIFVVLSVVLSHTAANSFLRSEEPIPEFSVEINEKSGLIKLDLKESLGLICYKDGSDNVAKVACGGEGTSSEAGTESLGDEPVEFSVDMTCLGDEKKLSKCNINALQQFHKCDKFVAAHCGGRRSLTSVL